MGCCLLKIKNIIITSLATAILLISSPAYSGLNEIPVDSYSNRFDTHFRKYSKRFFGPTHDYRWWKSQAVIESALKPNAVSPVGARSLMQVMPRTWDEIIRKHKFIEDDPFNPRWAIAAGISYDKYLWDMWSAKRTFNDRMSIVFASYNGGAGNVLRAQRKCIAEGDTDCNTWAQISARASKIATWRYEESLNYVKRIMKLMGN